MAACERAYHRTRNPVYVWDAVASVLSGVDGLFDQHGHTALPDWTRPYFFTVALGIGRLSRDGRQPRKGDIAAAIARIVFPRYGRWNPFDAIAADAHELLIARDVYTCHTQNWYNHQRKLEGTFDWTSVYQEANRAHQQGCDRCRRRPLSDKTIEKYWRRHALLVIPRRLIDRAPSKKLDDILR